MKRILIALCALLGIIVSMQAQQTEYIDRNFKMDFPFNKIAIMGGPGELKGTAHLEVIDFGIKGRTVILKFDCPALNEEFKKMGREPKTQTYYSWSGKKVHLVKMTDSDGVYYIVMRGNINRFKTGALLLRTKDGSLLQIKNEEGVGTLNYDIHKGMSRAEVERFLAGKGMKFQQTGNAGNLRIWSLKWLQLQDVYNIFGEVDHAEFNNDKKYIDFYFDANDKLVKWIVLL